MNANMFAFVAFPDFFSRANCSVAISEIYQSLGHMCGESAQKQLISLWYFYTGGSMQVPITQTKSSRQLLLPDKINK